MCPRMRKKSEKAVVPSHAVNGEIRPMAVGLVSAASSNRWLAEENNSMGEFCGSFLQKLFFKGGN